MSFPKVLFLVLFSPDNYYRYVDILFYHAEENILIINKLQSLMWSAITALGYMWSEENMAFIGIIMFFAEMKLAYIYTIPVDF